MDQDEYAGVLQAAQEPQQPSALAPKSAAVLTTTAPLLACQAAGLLHTSAPGPAPCDTPAVVKPKPAAAQQQQPHKAVQQLTADRQQAVQGHAHAEPQGQARAALQASHADAAGQQARVRKKRKTTASKAGQALQSEAHPLESQQQQQQQQQQLNKQVHACMASVATQTDAWLATDTAELLEGGPAQAGDTGKVCRQAAQGGNTFPVVASPYLSTGCAVSLCPTAPLAASPNRAVVVQHRTPALEACKEQNTDLACGIQKKPDSGSLLARNLLLQGVPVPTPSAHSPSQDKAAHAGFTTAKDSVPMSQPVVLIGSTNTSKKQSKRKRKHASLGAARGKVTHCDSSA